MSARLAPLAAAMALLMGWAVVAQPAGSAAAATLSPVPVSPVPAPTVRVARAAVAQGAAVARAAQASAPAAVHAKGAALADAATGRLLWSRAQDTERPMGSITKVMTALVVIRAGGLARDLTVPAAAVSYARKYGGSTAGLRAGDRLSTQQLLEALLVPSGCDAAYVLARAYGPGLTGFVAKMNALARQMGLGRTHFSNFDGLPWPTEHSTYSTPGDLLAIGRAAMASAIFRSIVDQRSYHLTAGSGHHAYGWKNTNMLLGSYPGAIGIKTGSTNAAGYCLLFEARHGSRSLIGVVLDSSATTRAVSFSDAEQILNWGFR
ncbi:MAG TPA: serine hydrolase [Streptosporangiaceae bacterium]|nr:serine hydrolase [Streptosporangiaceae bacterium]